MPGYGQTSLTASFSFHHNGEILWVKTLMKNRSMRKLTILFLFLLSLNWACSGTTGSDLKTIQGDPEKLYKQGLTRFNKRDYDEARKKFEELKSSFPDSPPFTTWAELKIADSEFLLKNYVEAIAAYEEFKKVHPSHEEIPYVQFQIGTAHFNQMLTLDRDQTSTARALAAFEYLIATYPPSLFTEKAKEKIGTCRKRLADHEFYIGNFYFRRDKYQAAAARFEGLLEKYPRTQGEDHTLLLLARSYLELEQFEKAGQRLNQLVALYGKSPYAREAKALLEQGAKAPKNSSKKTEKKGTREADPSEDTGQNSIPLVKFDEEGRKPVSLSLTVPREPSQTLSPIEKPRAIKSSSSGVPALEGRAKPAPPSSPPPSKPGAETKPGEVKRAAALPGPPAQPKPDAKEKARDGLLPGWKQEKGEEPPQPIEITSDRVETYTNDNLILFKGNVVARQKDMIIYADSLDAVVAGEGKGIERVIAGGNVKITQGVRTAQSRKAVFDNIEKKVVLTGDPKVWEGEQLISGDEIVFDIDRNRMEVKGGSGGRGKAKVYPKGDFGRKE
jgi:outer membrane protein assembly factor BamD